jgi:hypothetical protein
VAVFEWTETNGCELFLVHSRPRNPAINVQGIVSVFLLFFSRDIVHEIVVEMNSYAENL